MIKIFAISIPRFEARLKHIKDQLRQRTKLPWDVVGVDALELRKSAQQWPHNEKLRDSEVGCALSHVQACRRVVADGADWALIIEDDVLLPGNIDHILRTLSSVISPAEVISLYNRTLLPEKFSTHNFEPVLDMRLLYPMETRFMRTAAAYFLDWQAAERISRFNSPVNVVADNWAAYFQAGVIDSIRLLHPIPVSLLPLESTLSLDRGNKVQRISKRLVSSIPFLSKLREKRRRWIERKRERHLILVDRPSDQVRYRSHFQQVDPPEHAR